VAQTGGVSYFRLNLVDKVGNRIQKVYALHNTITLPLGIVAGWESNTMPAWPPSRRGRRHR
jgi:hypothetical protein